jgi:lipoprotein-anchoring transpeptidase ErfK/SrfK
MQLVHIYEDGVETRSMPCSTGLPDPQMSTPAWEGVVGEYWGTFFAYDVYADEAWYLFKSLGSILIHSSPYTIENDVKVYQDMEILGVRPASHGCIRMSPEDALWFTEWGPEGVPIIITPLEDH